MTQVRQGSAHILHRLLSQVTTVCLETILAFGAQFHIKFEAKNAVETSEAVGV